MDLVTLPARDTVQVTIYNSADLTLVRESRALTLKEGANSLQFSWENTLIDPTSLEMMPKANADKIDIAELAYPPRVKNLGVWNITSGVSGKVPVEITYLTSGLSWRAFYMGTLTEDEKTMRLQGYVLVTNNSGEDYENAQTRLIVGQVHILDQIAELARRQYPYGRPGGVVTARDAGVSRPAMMGGMARLARAWRRMESSPAESGPRKSSRRASASTSSTRSKARRRFRPAGRSGCRALTSTACAGRQPVQVSRKSATARSVVRFLSFKNDTEHKLGADAHPRWNAEGLSRCGRQAAPVATRGSRRSSTSRWTRRWS